MASSLEAKMSPVKCYLWWGIKKRRDNPPHPCCEIPWQQLGKLPQLQGFSERFSSKSARVRSLQTATGQAISKWSSKLHERKTKISGKNPYWSSEMEGDIKRSRLTSLKQRPSQRKAKVRDWRRKRDSLNARNKGFKGSFINLPPNLPPFKTSTYLAL